MQYYLVAPTIRAHHTGIFTYQSDLTLKKGSIVTIQVGKKQSIGIVIDKTKKPSFKTKPILSLVIPSPLPPQLVDLALWMSDYYATPISTVWQTILPRGVEKKRRPRDATPSSVTRKNMSFILTTDQKKALQQIRDLGNTTALLQGVTGSGKTAIYQEIAKETLAQNQSVVLLVPEIALTSQLVAEFSHHFKDVIVTHSNLTEAERHTIWQKILDSDAPQIIIGPRSALFMPLSRVGLIVIDECHESSFKQEQSPRYSALRVARILASSHQAKLILGSATPSVSDRYIAEKNKSLVRLDQTAKKVGEVNIKLIDSKKRAYFSDHRFFSKPFLDELNKTLEQKQQALVFHNRRGTASTTLCENCGWTSHCPRCHLPLTLHTDVFALLCHTCGLKEKVPSSCPVCNHTNIIHKGIGTKLIHDELVKLFPNKKVVRFDADTDQKNSLEKTYQSIYDGDVDIIIGTQIIAKGLDLPRLSFVGVVQADSGLSLPDFASSERTFQLLYQVMGRVGRDEKLSSIVIQSFQPDHPAVAFALAKDFDGFYDYCIKERNRDAFPPFVYLLKATCSYSSEEAASMAAQKIKKLLSSHLTSESQILGPTPAFYERVRDQYRWQLIVKSTSRSQLVQLLRHIPTTHWQVELDPTSLL